MLFEKSLGCGFSFANNLTDLAVGKQQQVLTLNSQLVSLNLELRNKNGNFLCGVKSFKVLPNPERLLQYYFFTPSNSKISETGR